MDDLVKGQISVDKVFYRKERDQFYGDWTIAFWRELFQNSVDAGSKKIDIRIEEVAQRGSFGAPGPADKKTVNVVFADDGHGMTAEVLNDVYFKMGKSTKDADGSNIGGFGRARIMTCFSQESYRILTGHRFVMGDGVHFEHGHVGTQIMQLEKYAAALAALGTPEAETSLEGIRADIEMLQNAYVKRGGYPGCRVEVDIDQSEPTSWRSRKGTLENMNKALRTYLSESQLPCEVTINGKTPEEHFGFEDGKLQARRGPARRTLAVADENNVPSQFATVHVSEGEKAWHKGKVVVRVSGASMYAKSVDGLDAQVIVEIDPTLSRDALNSNRDGLKSDYDRALDKLLQELTVDTLSALKDKTGKVESIGGTKGRIASRAADLDVIAQKRLTDDEIGDILDSAKSMPKVSSIERVAELGVHQDHINSFLKSTYYGSSFLTDYLDRNWDKYDEFHEKLRDFKTDAYCNMREADWLLNSADEEVRSWILAAIRIKVVEEERARKRADEASKIDGVNDIYIKMENVNDKIKAAARRHHPGQWSTETGKGKAMRSLLCVWTAACSAAVETLYKVRPQTKPITWTTGFVYSMPELRYEGDTSRPTATKALCVALEGNDYRLLVNPVTDDGNLRYSPSNEDDMKRILSLAFHEAAHILETAHNETYAQVLTELMAETDWKAAFKRMKTEYAAVIATYAEGKARVHALDREGGPRPAERLLARANGNDWEAAQRNSSSDHDGVVEIDTDAMWSERVAGEEASADPDLNYARGL